MKNFMQFTPMKVIRLSALRSNPFPNPFALQTSLPVSAYHPLSVSKIRL
jgi:hypothetical protein